MAPETNERALVSTCPDGYVIRTPWPGLRWSLATQLAHADHHRSRVRMYLEREGMARLRRS